jgi:hypothetical protein
MLETRWKQQESQSELGEGSQSAITRGSGGSATIAHGKQSLSTFTIALPSASEQLVGSICVEERTSEHAPLRLHAANSDFRQCTLRFIRAKTGFFKICVNYWLWCFILSCVWGYKDGTTVLCICGHMSVYFDIRWHSPCLQYGGVRTTVWLRSVSNQLIPSVP